MQNTTTVYVKRLGAHHFAHLRAIAEGVDVLASATRYLGIEHGHQAKTAHRQTIDLVRAVARRRRENGWRLIGLTIKIETDTPPSLEVFRAEHPELDDWSDDDLLQMYPEVFAASTKSRKSQRRSGLRERQLLLIKRLQDLDAEVPSESDLLTSWYDDSTAAKLLGAGMVTLGDLQQKIAVGGRWYRAMPAVGPTKAARIASHLSTLLGDQPTPIHFSFSLAGSVAPPQAARMSNVLAIDGTPPLSVDWYASDRSFGSPALLTAPTSTFGSDAEAIAGWIAARAVSPATIKSYNREATRLLLWLRYERGGITLQDVTAADCTAYMGFLKDVPQHWISRKRAAPSELGWAPFRGPLSLRSYQHAIVVIASLFTWLVASRYVGANPWVLVNRKTGDDKGHKMLETKALSDGATHELLRFIGAQPPSPARDRFRFILLFIESVGLRSAEILSARLGDFDLLPEGWVMQVHGKGAKNRIVTVPGQAFHALQEYLIARGAGTIETADPSLPLITSIKDLTQPIGYQALYEHVRGWLSKGVNSSDLPLKERNRLAKASTHWLRHTFGTKAVALGVPADVIQAQMGHASIQTTLNIYGKAPLKRQADELGKAFGTSSQSQSG